MHRRKFISILGATAAVTTSALRAQSPLPVIGFLSPRSAEDSKAAVASFLNGLKQEAYIAGQNVVVSYQWAEGQYNQLPVLAAALTRENVAAIAAFSPPAALAAKSVTSTIPIVFTSGDDPVRAGLVTSINRPESNLTGVSFFSSQLGAKRLELLREVLGNVYSVAVILNERNPNAREETASAQQAAEILGMQLHLFNASRDDELASAFAAINRGGIDALWVASDPFFSSRSALIAASAAQYKVPAVYVHRDFVAAGGLISYGASLIDSYRQAGVYVGRILKGAKPTDLPVEQPTKFELGLNMKAAKALNLTIPATILAIADEVVE
jgi:putative ABC transport system substrate-binding protein